MNGPELTPFEEKQLEQIVEADMEFCKETQICLWCGHEYIQGMSCRVCWEADQIDKNNDD